jgi:hypothetical protein
MMFVFGPGSSLAQMLAIKSFVGIFGQLAIVFSQTVRRITGIYKLGETSLSDMIIETDLK